MGSSLNMEEELQLQDFENWPEFEQKYPECPECFGQLIVEGHCSTCTICGWSACDI